MIPQLLHIKLYITKGFSKYFKWNKFHFNQSIWIFQWYSKVRYHSFLALDYPFKFKFFTITRAIIIKTILKYYALCSLIITSFIDFVIYFTEIWAFIFAFKDCNLGFIVYAKLTIFFVSGFIFACILIVSHHFFIWYNSKCFHFYHNIC